MRRIGVTITGADEGVDPYQLFHLGRFYPFVEWGVLFSEKRRGTARYPGARWLYELETLAHREEGMRLSMHLCGHESRIAMASASTDAFFWPGQVWRRVQLNGYELGAATPQWRNSMLGRGWPHFRWILQLRDPAGIEIARRDAVETHADGLFDPSGGTGAKSAGWPVVPEDKPFVVNHGDRDPELFGCVRWGFAGGLGPDNLKDSVLAILDKNPMLTDFWVDMESGVRTEDKFDLDKVRAVLEVAAEILAGA